MGPVAVVWVGDHSMYALLADGAARQQDLEGLEKYVQLAEETALRYDHKLYLAISHRAWGVLHRLSGDYNQAETRLNTALTLFHELRTRWQTVLPLAELGQLAVEKANTEKAQTHFTQALFLFNQMGAKPDEDQVHVNLAALE
jgi:tetratricopeptide (TPR) repeat protein